MPTATDKDTFTPGRIMPMEGDGAMVYVPPNLEAALYSALVKAQRDAGAVVKDAKNTFQGYEYVSAESMFTVASANLGNHGLALVPHGKVDLVDTDKTVSTKAGTVPVYELRRTLLLIHEAGGSLEINAPPWPVIEGKGRPLDKALAGALTSSLRYVLRDLLLIPQSDDHDMDRRDDTAHQPGRGRQSSGRQQQQQGQQGPQGPRPTPEQEKALGEAVEKANFAIRQFVSVGRQDSARKALEGLRTVATSIEEDAVIVLRFAEDIRGPQEPCKNGCSVEPHESGGDQCTKCGTIYEGDKPPAEVEA